MFPRGSIVACCCFVVAIAGAGGGVGEQLDSVVVVGAIARSCCSVDEAELGEYGLGVESFFSMVVWQRDVAILLLLLLLLAALLCATAVLMNL